MGKNKVIFLSFIDFYGDTAGAARMRMYFRMLEAEGVEYKSYTMHDFYSLNAFARRLNSNKLVSVISDPLRILMYIFSIKKILNSEGSVVYYLYPTTRVLLDFLLILYLKFFRKNNIFLEVNEVRRFGVGIRKYSFSYFKYILHERLSAYFDGLVCISTNIEVYYRKYNLNTINIPILSDVNEPFKSNCTYNFADPFAIGFTGSVHVEKENLEVFLSGLSLLIGRGFSVTLNLYGPLYGKYKFFKMLNKYGISDCVKYHGIISAKNIPSILYEQDLLILPRAESMQNRYGFSTKLSEYLVSGVPILLTDVSDNLVYLTNKKDCLVADWKSDQSFSDQIESLILNYHDVAPVMAENAYEVARKNFYYKVSAAKYKKFIGAG
jgi:glycosyltransferase involved in cell wall biosynthesis